MTVPAPRAPAPPPAPTRASRIVTVLAGLLFLALAVGFVYVAVFLVRAASLTP